MVIVAVIAFFVGAAVYQYDPGQLILFAGTGLLFGAMALAVVVFGFAVLANLIGRLLKS